MKMKILPQSIFGKLSVLFGLLTPALFFIAFMVDSMVLIQLTPLIVLAWLISGIIALYKRDWSLVTIISAITSVFVLLQFLSEPWVKDIISSLFRR